jgi:hypothetical protein
MSDQDKDAFETGEPNEFMPGDEDFEDEFEEEEEELERAPAGARAEAREAERAGRRFRFGRGGEEEEHVPGSVRTSHERVRVDDRLSAAFALLCALGLVGVLVFGYLGQYMPKAASKPLPTLSLETFVPTPTVSANPSASGSASLVPTASPTASPSS